MMLQRRIESWRFPEAAMFAYAVAVVGNVDDDDDDLHLKLMTSCRQCSSFLRCFDTTHKTTTSNYT